MSEANQLGIASCLPVGGFAFHTDSEWPLAEVSADLSRIAALLQEHAAASKLRLYHDWWEHDGLHFPAKRTDFHRLFRTFATPRTLLESMTGDFRVFIGVAPHDRDWYLRFYADCDDDDTNLVGEYSISLAPQYVDAFAAKIVPQLNCAITREDVVAYFKRIEA